MLSASQTPFVNAPARFFAKENGEEGESTSADEQAEEVEEAVPEPTPAPKPEAAAPKKSGGIASDAASQATFDAVDKSLFTPFSVGDIKKIDSTPDHKAPSEEDTIEGRYAAVLFTTASQNGDLYNVYEDLKFLQGIYANSEQFRLFTENGGVGSVEI